jgi:ATP adenylyltransferase
VGYEEIWAPWRLEYILGDKQTPQPEKPLEYLPGADPGCFICQCAVAEDHRQRLTVCQDEHAITVLNRYPYNNGHLLVAPQRHHERLDQLSDEVQLAISRMITRMIGLLEDLISPEGFNIGLNLGRPAGAGVPGHLHWHLVPRWSGDNNFMPVTGDSRIISQSLRELWEAVVRRLGILA